MKHSFVQYLSKFLLYALLFIPGIAFTQNATWNWGINPESREYDNAVDITVDNSGNILMVGSFNSDSISFFGDTTLFPNPTTGKYYIAKYDSLGNFINVRAFSHSGFSSLIVSGIEVDSNSNIYLFGWYRNSISISPGNTFPVSPDGAAFIVKLDSAWQVQWSVFETAPANTVRSAFFQKIKIDLSGNVYAIGNYTKDSVIFGNYTVHNPNTQGNSNLFIVKYDSSGNALWAKGCGSNQLDNEDFSGLAIDLSGNVLVCGTFETDTIWFDNYFIVNSFVNDLFMAKYSTSGNVIWVEDVPGFSQRVATDIGTDDNGNVYLIGGYYGQLIFDSVVLPNLNQGIQAFIAKFDQNGNCVWAKTPEGNDQDRMEKIFVDHTGNLVIGGTFNSDSLIFPGATLYPIAGFDLFFAGYDAWGSFLWAQSAGDISSQEELHDLLVDDNGNFYITGLFFRDSISFGNITLYNTYSNNGSYPDLFLIRVSPVLFSGLEEVQEGNFQYTIFPNPASEVIFIESNSIQEQLEIIISDISGRVVYTKEYSNVYRAEVNSSALASGVYLVQLRNGTASERRKIIVDR